MLRNAKIRTRLAAMAVVPIALIAVLAVASYLVVQNLSVNGPAYNRIAASKDFVAETNTSKLYILRASVISHQAVVATNVSQRSGLLGQMDGFRRDYEAVYARWLPQVTDPAVRTNLVDSYDAAQRYFDLFDNRFRVDLNAGDQASALKTLNDEMDVAFLQHEAAIQRIVATSAQAQRAEEVAAEAQKQRDSRILGALMIVLALITAALGFTTLRSITRRLDRLREVATKDLPRTIESVKTAALAGEDLPAFEPVQIGGRDELTETGAAFNSVIGTAVDLAADQARTRRATAEMFVNLGRRNHKLLSRTLTYISQLERDERDPGTLQNLFKLDHLTTRMRRHAESLLVLAGSAPLRTWSRPVPVSDVLRSALSEIESYDRVDVTGMDEVFVKGAVVSDIAHLLAELLENATTFSPPHTRVRVVGRGNAKRYHVIIVDEGIGMTPEDLMAANEMLAHGHEQGVEALGTSRMLGLGVVARLAARHSMAVGLDDSPVGGVVAKITLPPAVLADAAAVNDLTAASSPATGATAVVADGPRPGGPVTAPTAALSVANAAPQADAVQHPVTAPVTTSLPRRGAAATSPVPTGSAPQVIDLREDTAGEAPAQAPAARSADGGVPLRRRVRGAQLPETGALPATPGPPVERDAASVRNALSSFALGRQGGEHAVTRTPPTGPVPTTPVPTTPVPTTPVPTTPVPITPGPGAPVTSGSTPSAAPAPPQSPPTAPGQAAVTGTDGRSVPDRLNGHRIPPVPPPASAPGGHGGLNGHAGPNGHGLPMRRPGSTGAGDMSATSAFRFTGDPQPPLRRRVKGAQLPDMSTPAAPVTPPADRTAESVRSALSSFVAGQRSARDG